VARELVVKVALPLERDAVPNAADPLLNVTAPVGVAVPEAGETFAVKVTLVPALACGVETVNAVVVVVFRLNVPVTDCAILIVTVQLPVPVQPPPLHPVKSEPAAALADNVTLVPLAKLALHVPGQLIPVGTLVTMPEPLPAIVTDNAKFMTNVAVTVCAALIVTVQLPVPVQPPPFHPVKVEFAAALADNVTLVPLAKLALQVPGQLIPVGTLVTVPDPLPAIVTDSWNVTVAVKVAVTARAALIVTAQLPVPVQAPLQPAKVEPVAGVSAKVTLVPLAKLALQLPGQLMPAGVLVTVPLPVPAAVTVRGNVAVAVQLGKLKLAMRVFQLNTPLVLMYSWVYQKVQSSTGSICMAL
jgi:hypothetical protein